LNPPNEEGQVKLNLGNGRRRIVGYYNIDIRAEMNPDIVCDVTCGLPFKDNSVDEILANDFLEHIPLGKTVYVIEEIWRVLKPDGIFRHQTPSTDGRGAFMDPHHISFWNINSWWYYCDDAHRNLYGIKAKFKGTLKDILTDKEHNIIHTIGDLRAVK